MTNIEILDQVKSVDQLIKEKSAIVLHKYVEEKMTFDCTFDNKVNVVPTSGVVIENRLLVEKYGPKLKPGSRKGDCRPKNILRLLELNTGNYLIQVRFTKPEQFRDHVQSATFTLTTKNTKISWFKLGFRYFFVTISFIATILFTYTIRTLPLKYQTIEHKLIVSLGFCLIYYNDPFAIIHTIKPTLFSYLFL